MSYPLYILFGVLPSVIWLLFYLRKDVHPEPKSEVIKIFFWGMLIAIPAVFLEMGIFQAFGKLGEFFHWSHFLIAIFNIFIGVALIEEVLKYLVVREGILKNPEFDEPIDLVLYMIIAALGFAALENILILFRLGPAFLFSQALEISALRFLGATFLHALCSGTLGFFLAISFFETSKRRQFFSLGLGISIVLHGFYNFSILKIEGPFQFLIPIMILVGLAAFLSFGFKKLKKLKSVCKIE